MYTRIGSRPELICQDLFSLDSAKLVARFI